LGQDADRSPISAAAAADVHAAQFAHPTGSAAGGHRSETALIDDTPFLDRVEELAALESAFEAAAAGHGSLVLVGGEAGIGKTRLVTELLARAAGRPSTPRVVWGRCWEGGGAPSLWPWTCVLRELFGAFDEHALRDYLRSAAPLLGSLVPDLRELLPELANEPVPDLEQSRVVLFDALASFLRRVSARRPLVVVLDDIHAADQLSLMALLFVAREAAESHVLLIATHRENEMQRTANLAGLFTKLLRAGRRIALSGLQPDQLGQLIEHHSGRAGDPAVAANLHRATGGNPFFADEVLRTLISEGDLDSLLDDQVLPRRMPMGVRALIEQRLEDLPEAAVRALQSASVIGGRFSLATLGQVTGRPRPELLEALEAAIDARLIELNDGDVAQFGFVHDMVRETIYAGMPPLARARAHGAVAEALNRQRGGSERQVEELAHHFLRALPAVDPAIAVDYARRAGDHAMGRFAHERAARFFHSGLEALELVDGLSDQERALTRAQLLIGEGRAQLRFADAGARETLLEAAAAARLSASPETLATVALTFGAFGLSPGRVDQDLTDLLEEALGSLDDGDSLLRVHLLARLARALYWSDEDGRRQGLIEAAVAMARRLDDAEALAIALGNCIPANRSPDSADADLQWIDEFLGLPQTPGELVVLARSIQIDLLLERGAIGAADAAIDSLDHHAERLRDLRARAYVPVHRARRAVMAGRFEEARGLIEDAVAISHDIEDSTIPLIAIGQRFTLEWMKGRGDAVEQEFRRVAAAAPYLPVWRVGLALIRETAGDRVEAQQLLDALAARDFEDIPRNNQWLITLSLLADLCARLGDVARGARLRELLLPYADRMAVNPAGVYAGPVARYLGLLAHLAGDEAAAEAQLRTALEIAREQRASPMIAMLTVDLARTLIKQDTGAAVSEAALLIEEARMISVELGAPALAERAHAVAAALGDVGPQDPVPPAPAPESVAILAREGEVWTFELAGRPVRVRDSKGIRHLAELLSQPGVDIHALDLVQGAGARAGAVSAAAASDAGLTVGDAAVGTGAALDGPAKAAYKRRIEDLREEVEEAVQWGDPERAARAREEIEFIARELAAAVGLGGRDRPQASDAERARVNVTRAIKTAVRKLAAQDAELGAELEATVHTGLFCRHDPDPRRPLRWQVVP
jgi:tetratricopeptide (TPR) repeat protein